MTTATPDTRNADRCAHCGESITTDYSVTPPAWTHWTPGTETDRVDCED